MTSKEVRVALKFAKECIQAKNYGQAIKHCEKVLAADEQNYHALVFLGVANENLGHGRDCVDAYTKATEISPDQILAWQGLMSYYEKNPNKQNNEKLAPVYMKIIRLNEDLGGQGEKIYKLQLKLGDLLANMDDESQHDEAMCVFMQILRNQPKSEPVSEKRTTIHRRLLSMTILRGESHSMNEQSLEYLLFNNLAHDEMSTDRLCTEYLNAVYDRHPLAVQTACQKLQEAGVQSVVPWEIGLSVTLDKAIACDVPLPEESSVAIKNIEQLNEDSSVLKAWKIHAFCLERKFTEAKNLCQDLLKSNVAAFRLLAVKVDSGMHNTESVDKSVDEILKNITNRRLKMYSEEKGIMKKLLMLQVDALLQEKEEDKVGKAGKIIKQLKTDHDCPEVDVLLCYLCLKVHNETLAGKIRERLTEETADELAVIGWYYWYTKDFDQARTYLERAVKKDPDEPNFLCQLARVYWSLIDNSFVDHKQCSIALMKAAKLDPFCSNIFFWLGRYFEKYGRDDEKALRCYRKAYDLKITNESAAEYLVDVLDRLGNEDEALEVVTEVTENVSTAKWAWLRLGLYRVKEDAAAAIQCFQIAIRADPSDAYCWQCLAEGYMNRGSFNAAMKTFTKANELDPKCMYNLFQLANIKQLLGMHLDAVADYQKILEDKKDYVPALKGLAETHLQMAKDAMDKFYSLKAIDNCSLAIGYLSKASERRPDLAMVWKLIGDSCTVIADVPASMVKVTVPKRLCGEWKYDALGLSDLLKVGARAYTKALQLAEEDSVLWYDLGVNFFHQHRVSADTDPLEKAINCLRKSLTLSPKESVSWSTLGVFLAKREDRAEAQHCFIQAVELDSHNAEAWANLGVLYLVIGTVALAHEAFKNAQSMAPEYVNGWIGQAMVAESVAHGETSDLFRHSSELALHEEAALGYGHWITELLLQGEDIPEGVVLNATTCLERYLNRDERNPIALNMYGILLERQGLVQSALETFEKAVASADDDILPVLKTNYARLLCKTDKFESAISELENLENVHIPLGLTYFKAKSYENAGSEYQTALEKSTDATDPQLRTMLGLSSYFLGDLEDAKTHLFACAQASDPQVYGLLALCGVGLLNNDLTLAGAVIQELDKFITEKTVADICKFAVMYYIANDELDSAFTFVQNQIEVFPQNVELYLQMISISELKESELVDKVLETRSFEPGNFHKICRICMESGKPDLAFRYAHNDLVMFPNDESKWSVLAYTMILKILHCDDIKICSKFVDALITVVGRCNIESEVSNLKMFSSNLVEFRAKLTEIPEEFIEKVDFVVGMFEKYHHVLFEEAENDDEKENKPEETIDESDEKSAEITEVKVTIDREALLLHGFIEILAISLKNPSFSNEITALNEILGFYKSSGVYQFDHDTFTRDERVYTRKSAVKKNSKVRFPRAGLSSRLRCLAYDIIAPV